MTKHGTLFGLLVVVLILSGCSSARIWTSTPPIQLADNPHFSTQFEPIRVDAEFINGFRLTVTNKSYQTLVVDWNATLYLLNNKNTGRFIFEGVDKKNINDLPPDRIAAGESLRKEIFPLKLIAWRQGPGFVNLPAFSPGPVPEGQNGILLVILRNDEPVQEKINVTIKVSTK